MHPSTHAHKPTRSTPTHARHGRAGNNAVEMGTTATYDASTQEFIVRTPSTLAQKYWITGAALHAK